MLKPYQFPTKRVKGTPPKPRALPRPSRELPTFSYPGVTRPEEYVYRALLEIGYRQEDIAIQTPISGGRSVPGGFVGDIVVYKPHLCLITVKGAYWHSDDEKEFLDDAHLAGEYSEYIVIWDYEIPTYEAALQVVITRVGRPL